MIRKFAMILVFVWAALVFAGCNKGAEQTTTDGQKMGPPVTIKIAINQSGYLDENEFQKYVIDPVTKKYPNITIEKVVTDGKTITPQTLVASGDIPDIFIAPLQDLSAYNTLGILDNIEPLMKKQNVDAGKFQPVTLDSVKISSGLDYLSGIPYTMHFSALYYNKDIFDRFGVPYPKDGMSWADVTELAKTMTREVDGVQYHGLADDTVLRPASALSLPMLDPKTLKATVNTDGWKKVFETMKQVYDIPGNMKISTSITDQFSKSKTLAMYTNLNMLARFHAIPDLNWDLVTWPTMDGAPNTGMQVDEHVMAISKSSMHKDEAMQVISTVVSDEVQTEMAKDGRVSVLKDDKYKTVFGQNQDYLKGKNLQAVLRMQQAKPVPGTKFDSIAKKVIGDAFQSVLDGKKDVNSALRDADQEINQQVDAAKQQQ